MQTFAVTYKIERYTIDQSESKIKTYGKTMSKKKSKKIRKEQAQKFNSTEPEHPELAAEKTAAIDSCIKDSDYRLRCKAAIDILMAKLKMINAELSGQKKRTVISQTTSRIKSAESIYAKLLKKGLEPDFETARKNLKDLIGIRVVCPFEDELYQVAEFLEMQKDIEIVRIKDYIKNPKKNGYKSLHLIVKVPIYSAEGEQKELVEIQLRTIAMDYWSVLEYELYYKKRDNAEIEAELKKYAEEIANLDYKMLKLRNKIEKIGYKETNYEIKFKKSEQSANVRSECLFYDKPVKLLHQKRRNIWKH